MNRMRKYIDQSNSFACKKCKIIYTEESGAYKGFICEDCE